MSVTHRGLATVVDDQTSHLSNPLRPQTTIVIAVDVDYVVQNGGGQISQGVYMVDNRWQRGSKGEGGLELATYCNLGDLIGWQAFPINGLEANAGSVAITGFNVSAGNVFGSAGYPVQYTSPNYWVGQAMNGGSQTYQISMAVTTGGLRPRTVNVFWDPFITAE